MRGKGEGVICVTQFLDVGHIASLFGAQVYSLSTIYQWCIELIPFLSFPITHTSTLEFGQNTPIVTSTEKTHSILDKLHTHTSTALF